MGFESFPFWFFLATATVASLAFVSIMVWVESRRKEQAESRRLEFRSRLIETDKITAESLASLVRYEHDLKLRQSREKLLITAFVILGTGVGTCMGLQLAGGWVWMLGLIPASIGVFMLAYGFLFAANPSPSEPPLGWSAELNQGA